MTVHISCLAFRILRLVNAAVGKVVGILSIGTVLTGKCKAQNILIVEYSMCSVDEALPGHAPFPTYVVPAIVLYPKKHPQAASSCLTLSFRALFSPAVLQFNVLSFIYSRTARTSQSIVPFRSIASVRHLTLLPVIRWVPAIRFRYRLLR